MSARIVFRATTWPLDGPSDGDLALVALAGYEIPYLPQPAASGGHLEVELERSLRRQIAFLRVFYPSGPEWSDGVDRALELRFVARPVPEGSARRVELFLLGRVGLPVADSLASRADLEGHARALLAHITSAMPPEYPLRPPGEASWRRAEPLAVADLTDSRQMVEIHKRLDEGMAAPFTQSPAEFSQLLRALLQTPGALVLAVRLTPTELRPEESTALLGRSLTWTTGDGGAAAEPGQGRAPDPAREWQRRRQERLATMAGDYWRRLRRPFQIQIQVAGDQPLPAGLIQVVGTELSGDSASVAEGGGFMARRSAAPGELALAADNLLTLALRPWGRLGPTPASQLECLLPYLVDAAEANCAFRLPLVTPRGVPGMGAIPFNPFTGAPAGSAPGDGRPELCLGRDVRDAHFGPKLSALTRHTLVVGSTGSGKTACQTLLAGLAEHNKPFLVVEPVKSGYRRLLGQDTFQNGRPKESILFLTPGDELSPFHINPFQIPVGVAVGAYISALKACFTAAFPLEGPLAIILERAIRQVYADLDWKKPGHRVTGRENRRFPTLSDLCRLLSGEPGRPGFVAGLGYGPDIEQNMEAALANLRESVLGHALNVERTGPWSWPGLLRQPKVVELDALVDGDEKALFMALIFTTITFHRKVAQRQELEAGLSRNRLTHLLLIEEAHRLFANTGVRHDPGAVSTRAVATGVFADMLAEVREMGLGLVILDQLPTRLAADIIKQPDLKIMHRLTADDDRQIIGSVMNFSEEHRWFVTTLEQGQAAVHVEGLHATVLVYVDPPRGDAPPLTELALFRYMARQRLCAAATLRPPSFTPCETSPNGRSPSYRPEAWPFPKSFPRRRGRRPWT